MRKITISCTNSQALDPCSLWIIKSKKYALFVFIMLPNIRLRHDLPSSPTKGKRTWDEKQNQHFVSSIKLLCSMQDTVYSKIWSGATSNSIIAFLAVEQGLPIGSVLQFMEIKILGIGVRWSWVGWETAKRYRGTTMGNILNVTAYGKDGNTRCILTWTCQAKNFDQSKALTRPIHRIKSGAEINFEMSA